MKHVSLIFFPMCFLSAAQVALAQQCPQGQQAYQSGRVVSAVRDVLVPGTASGMFSGVTMRKGLDYQISATGSIRVGVFGETGTPPEGWEPQGPAGQGFPSPSAYTFSLIFRVGRTAAWNFAGPGPTTARLKATDPEQAELFFAINDTKTSDNSGGFNVQVKEIGITYQCRVPPPPPTTTAPRTGGFVGASRSGTTKPNRPGTALKLPCEGRTPDGRRQNFFFGEKCPGVDTTRTIPIEACTYDEAREQAAQSVAFGCHIAEIK
jgi:hypothetical protein